MLPAHKLVQLLEKKGKGWFPTRTRDSRTRRTASPNLSSPILGIHIPIRDIRSNPMDSSWTSPACLAPLIRTRGVTPSQGFHSPNRVQTKRSPINNCQRVHKNHAVLSKCGRVSIVQRQSSFRDPNNLCRPRSLHWNASMTVSSNSLG